MFRRTPSNPSRLVERHRSLRATVTQRQHPLVEYPGLSFYDLVIERLIPRGNGLFEFVTATSIVGDEHFSYNERAKATAAMMKQGVDDICQRSCPNWRGAGRVALAEDERALIQGLANKLRKRS